MITKIWVGMTAASLVFAVISGNLSQLSSAVTDGAGAAVQLIFRMCGITCLWSALMKVMERSGITAGLSRLLRPVLSHLFPKSSNNREAFESITQNVSANLLGLGNAATPAGIRAVTLMAEPLTDGIASDEMCRFVVINTASIQLIPATVAGIRAAAGAVSPFDIIPAVWITSIISASAGLICAKLLSRIS